MAIENYSVPVVHPVYKTAAEWNTDKNQILEKGQFGIILEENNMKIGDGVTTFENLRKVVTPITGEMYDTGNAIKTIYVAISGNDILGDGSKTKPYRTVAKAWSMVPSITMKEYHIKLADGLYEENELVLARKTVPLFIIESESGNSDSVTIKTTNKRPIIYPWLMLGSTYIRNITLEGRDDLTTENGIYNARSGNLYVKNVTISKVKYGITVDQSSGFSDTTNISAIEACHRVSNCGFYTLYKTRGSAKYGFFGSSGIFMHAGNDLPEYTVSLHILNNGAQFKRHYNATDQNIALGFQQIYVDPVNGNDNNTGTDSNPVKTITRAITKLSNINSDAMEICLKPGTYEITDTIYWYSVCCPLIIIRGTDNNNKPIINYTGSGNKNIFEFKKITGTLKIENINFNYNTNTNDKAHIIFADYINNVTVYNCEFKSIVSGINKIGIYVKQGRLISEDCIFRNLNISYSIGKASNANIVNSVCDNINTYIFADASFVTHNTDPKSIGSSRIVTLNSAQVFDSRDIHPRQYIDYIVDGSVTDDYLADGSAAKPFKTIKKAIEALPSIRANTARIRIKAGTYIEEPIFVRKPIGGETFISTFSGNKDVIWETRTTENNTNSHANVNFWPAQGNIVFQNIKFLCNQATNKTGLGVRVASSTYLLIENCEFDGFHHAAIFAGYNTTGRVTGCIFKNCDVGLYVFKNSNIQSENNTATNTRSTLESADGSIITLHGTQPVGTQMSQYTIRGGVFLPSSFLETTDKAGLISGIATKAVSPADLCGMITPDYTYNTLNENGDPTKITFSNGLIVNFVYRPDGKINYFTTPTHRVTFNYNENGYFIGKTTTTI